MIKQRSNEATKISPKALIRREKLRLFQKLLHLTKDNIDIDYCDVKFED